LRAWRFSSGEVAMTERVVAKLFRNGRSQAVRLPKEFRFRGEKVQVRRVNTGVLLEPVLDAKEWFVRLDSAGPGDFMAEGRDQPITPSRKILD
jgi:antitoxin VapB